MKHEILKYIEDSPILETLGREEGIPWIWVCGGALATILVMIVCLLSIVAGQGLLAHFPKEIKTFSSDDGQKNYGIVYREVEQDQLLMYAANRDFGTQEFFYVKPQDVTPGPKDIWYFERLEWGPFIGYPDAIITQNEQGTKDIYKNPKSAQIVEFIKSAKKRRDEISAFEKNELQPINREIEKIRLKRRHIERQNSSDKKSQFEALDRHEQELLTDYTVANDRLAQLIQNDNRFIFVLKNTAGSTKDVAASQMTRAFRPNNLNIFQKFKIYLARIWEFLSTEPREANSAGGVFPAIFGTVVMTLLMTLAVMPLGVLTAVYIREIAKQGMLVSFVRICVGNLAGVPSIVYGIFGLGFFCYTIGGQIDAMFFADNLPNPTFGTGGILWASLTLALLTVPVVIVATEEALAAVPRTLREASYGCGATRLQTLTRIVLPKALPGIMTGMILAMARGAGEVAPLLMTGVVKLAPSLPLDTQFPFVHLERSFMHLGFHIYDLGFQSRSTEVSRPMVFASTLLLIALVLILNFFAIKLRTMLRRRFEGRGAF